MKKQRITIRQNYPLNRKERKLNNLGFTLIELLVVMSIIAILFTIGMPIFSQFQNSSRLKESAQTVETVFGEAFSEARSRPEFFIVKGRENTLSLESYQDKNYQNKIISRDFPLNPGVKFSEDFEVKYLPPFGDIEIGDDNQNNVLEIEICNKECVNFKLYKKSGLLTRVLQENQDSGQSVSTNPNSDEK